MVLYTLEEMMLSTTMSLAEVPNIAIVKSVSKITKHRAPNYRRSKCKHHAFKGSTSGRNS